MKILDGIHQLHGHPAEIPDCGRDNLPAFFLEMGYKVGVEVGVLRGDFTETLCRQGLQVYAIDAWANYLDYHRHPYEEPYEEMYEATKTRLEPYNCTIIRSLSMDAVTHFKANSLDFVYIDGNHKLRHVLDDIYEWSIRVKPGGAVCGHDYEANTRSPHSHYACHVPYAVEVYTKVWGIQDFYLLGRKRPTDGEIRDKHRSWLWLKP